MNGLEERIKKLVSRIIDESKDLVNDVVDDMYYDGGAGIKDMCSQLYDLVKDQIWDELEDGKEMSDEMESDTCRAIDTAIKKNRKKIDSMVRCAIHEVQGG